MGRPSYDDCDTHAMSRNVMNYVKWKHRALKSRQYVIMATIFMVASMLFVTFFALILTGVIPMTKRGDNQISVVQSEFGVVNGSKTVHSFTLTNTAPGGIEVKVISLGPTLISLRTPDIRGNHDDVIFGFTNLTTDASSPGLGAVSGRFAGVINGGKFTLDGEKYNVINNVKHLYVYARHCTWQQVVWSAHIEDNKVVFNHVSMDGDGQFPGEIHAQVSFEVTSENELIISHVASVKNHPSPINMAIPLSFNLAGKDSSDVLGHQVTVNAKRFLPVTSDGIPTGDILDVKRTHYDLSSPKHLVDVVNTTNEYDVTYIVQGAQGRRLAARVQDVGSGRQMELFTDQTAVHLSVSSSTETDADIKRTSRFTMTLFSTAFPDAINHPNFPDCVLHPGSQYQHTTWYKFSTVT